MSVASSTFYLKISKPGVRVLKKFGGGELHDLTFMLMLQGLDGGAPAALQKGVFFPL